MVLTGLAYTDPPRVDPPPDKPIFDHLRVNFAWGFRCAGTYIDGSGRVYKYVCDKPDSSNPHFRTHIGGGDAVAERFYINDTLLYTVDSTRLVEMYRLLQIAVREPVIRTHRGYDMGGVGIHGLLYSDTSDVPIEVALVGSGDWSLRRQGPATDELLQWLGVNLRCGTVER